MTGKLQETRDEYGNRVLDTEKGYICLPREGWKFIDQVVAQARAEGRRQMREEINTPIVDDWKAGVPAEATHQQDRWGAEHDAGKGPLDWFWLIGYLAQKAAYAHIDGDIKKAKHHTISTAAALLNWHRALMGDCNAMRPGIALHDHPEDAG